jgi:hypothetical protein
VIKDDDDDDDDDYDDVYCCIITDTKEQNISEANSHSASQNTFPAF